MLIIMIFSISNFLQLVKQIFKKTLTSYLNLLLCLGRLISGIIIFEKKEKFFKIVVWVKIIFKKYFIF